jgi:hypothetical protein
MVKNEAKVFITGWLNDVKNFAWGNIGKIAVDQRRKNDVTGQWETVDKIIYDIVFEGAFPDAKQISVTGRINGINTFEKRDGTTGVSIKVRADSVEEIFDEAPLAPVTQIDAPF